MTLPDVPPPAAPPDLPPPPRPLSARARRQSWREHGARTWLLIALALLVVTLAFGSRRAWEAWTERRLIQDGRRVEARIERLNQATSPAIEFRRTNRLEADLAYTPSLGAAPVKLKGYLTTWERVPAGQSPILRVGMTLPIRVDPERPQRWTDRETPRPWAEELALATALAPLALVAGLAAWWRRGSALRAWRHGQPLRAVVVDHRTTPVAPRSVVVRATLADGPDRRVFSLLHPRRGAPAPGDSLWLLAPGGNPARAVVASLYA